MKMKYAILFMVIAMTLMFPGRVLAVTSVFNNTSALSSTGGNSADAGTISEGTSSAKVFLETIINGKVVENINESVESSGDENVIIEKEFIIPDEDKNATTQTYINLRAGEAAEQSQKVKQNVEDKQEDAEAAVVAAQEKRPFFLAVVFQKLMNYVFAVFN